MKIHLKALAAIMLMTAVFFAAGCTHEENNDNDVRVTTYTPQDITQTSAVCGGDVIVTQGLTLSELGVCWSTERNPTVEDAHISTTHWGEPYVCTISDLEPGTKYHVRAYALCGLEYYYGDDKSFSTEENSGGGGGLNGHDYVDLGLPSGTLWATCNVGATTPEGYGDSYAWGETEVKTVYDWTTYKFVDYYLPTLVSYYQLTKYCIIDNLTTLEPADDVAAAAWGKEWCMPTKEQWEELFNNTSHTWSTRNDVHGRLFTASNGNSLFLPAAGGFEGDQHVYVGSCGGYWSNSLYLDYTSLPIDLRDAWGFLFHSGGYNLGNYSRDYGRSVRPVRSAR